MLHAEWYDWVASKVGVVIDDGLIDSAIKEGLYYFSGEMDVMTPEIREFQRVLFMDYIWIRGVHDKYDLSSYLFRISADEIEKVSKYELR